MSVSVFIVGKMTSASPIEPSVVAERDLRLQQRLQRSTRLESATVEAGENIIEGFAANGSDPALYQNLTRFFPTPADASPSSFAVARASRDARACDSSHAL